MAGTRLLVVFALLLQVTCFSSSIREASAAAGCRNSGFIHGKGRNCPKEDEGGQLDSCCVAGKRYPQFRCSPAVSSSSAGTPGILTVLIFGEEDDQSGFSLCDRRFHRDTDLVVSLSSGWLRLDGTNRCNSTIRITAANGRSVQAKVVNECDSVHGCDVDRGFGPPCRNNVVSGTEGVWKALRLNETIGEVKVTWSDV